jgi:hypothetical protein
MSDTNRQRAWQLRWHEILNDFPDPDGGPSVTPDPLPELDADFRLQFNLWKAKARPLAPPRARRTAWPRSGGETRG